MSLRWRVAAALAAVAAVAAIAVGVISYRATSDRLLKEVDRSLDQAFRRIQEEPRFAMRDRGLLDVYVLQIVDESDRVVSNRDETIGPGPGPEQVRGFADRRSYDTLDTDDGDVRVVSIGAGADDGVFQVGRSLDEIESVLGDLRRRTVLLVLLVAAAAAAVGYLLARSVARPLARLTDAATGIERSGRLDVEVPVNGRDEVGRLGQAFNRMVGALAASHADQRRLVEDAGHELRTPLTSVRTNLAVLRRHPDLDPETRAKVLADLHVETEELVVLVEEVVALARGVADDTPPTEFVLGELVGGVVDRARRRTGREITVTADGTMVEASAPAVERAVSNLLDNAAKFDESGAPIEVVVAGATVTVEDRGPGFAAGDKAKVFDRFHRSEAARALPGSGLGLAIVRDVAERHGGTVRAANRPGGGASVGFTLGPHSVTSRA
ncbi:MAG: HAMP domain-containing histidine kinase [Acidimicrobiia bacterium]|nr:HAMP domain-containing histidine kinase [Acidimicrobiia bacterium]